MLDSLKEVMDVDHMLEVLKREGVVEASVSWQALPVFKAPGCNKCQGGYKGRVGIYEMFEMTSSLQGMLTATVTSDALEKAAKQEQNMVTMLEDGMMKVVQGVTSVEEVLRVAKE